MGGAKPKWVSAQVTVKFQGDVKTTHSPGTTMFDAVSSTVIPKLQSLG